MYRTQEAPSIGDCWFCGETGPAIEARTLASGVLYSTEYHQISGDGAAHPVCDVCWQRAEAPRPMFGYGRIAFTA